MEACEARGYNIYTFAKLGLHRLKRDILAET